VLTLTLLNNLSLNFFIKKKFYLLAIPLTVFLLGNFQLHDTYKFYMSWSDPQYCYLFNGLNFANGIADIGHTDHPGTPVQLFAALVIRITFLFRTADNLSYDVLQNPETYLFFISQSILLLVSFLLYFLGKFVLEKTQQTITALFFQTSTLFSFVISMYLPNPMTEPFIVVCSLMMIIFYIKFLYQPEKSENKFALILGSIAGLTLAVKFSTFPTLLIPLIIVTTWKSRILYGVTSIISFIVCTLPIMNKYVFFFEFIKGIFSHTGKYGTGDEQIINSQIFTENLQKIFYAGPTFSIIFFLSALFIVLVILKRMKLNKNEKTHFRLLLGIFIATILQILIVAKHYSYHYLIPVHIYSITSLFLIYFLTKKYYSSFNLPFINSNLFKGTLFTLFLFSLILKTIFLYGYFENSFNPRRHTSNFLEKYKNIPRIIVADNTAATSEPAMHFGFVYSGKAKNIYAPLLSEIYKHTYLYLLYDNKIRTFSEETTFKEVAANNPKLLLYFSQKKDSIEQNIFASVKEINKEKIIIKPELIFTNSLNGEKIYLLHIDTFTLKNNIKTNRTIFCNMENTDKDFFLSTDSLYVFKGAYLQSTEKSFSGKYAAKLTPEMMYGLDIPIQVNAGSTYKISVLRNAADNKGALVVSAKNSANFYKISEYANENTDWHPLKLTFTIPQNMHDSILSIYLWNNGKNSIWFDDLKITETE